MERNKETTNLNLIELKGKILHIYATKKTALVNVLTLDYKAPKPRDGKYRYAADTPTVVFFDDDAKMIAENFKVGDRVTIKAHNQSTYDHTRLESKQECWGDSIEKTENVLEGLTSKVQMYDEDANKVAIIGKVSKINKLTDTAAYVVVKTSDGKYPSFNSLYFTTRGIDSYLTRKQIGVGATVAAVGRLTTYRKAVTEKRTTVVNTIKVHNIETVIPASKEIMEGTNIGRSKKRDITPTIPAIVPTTEE